MELEQLQLDLLGLRQLYCLMQSCFSRQQNARVQILGGSARLLFKSLLDDATAEVFMASSKIVETPADELCSSPPEKTNNGVPKPKLIFKAPPRIISMQTQSKSTPPMAANSGLSTNPEKWKQCRACARKDMVKRKTFVVNNRDVSNEQVGKQTREPTENQNARESDRWRSYKTEKKRKAMRNETSSSLNSFISCSSTSQETTGYGLHCQRERKRLDSAVDYSEDISNTIKKIESHILALKLRSSSRNNTLETGLGRLSASPLRSDLLNNQVGQLSKNKPFTKAIPNQGLSLSSDFGETESVSRASQLHGCEQEVKRKARVRRIESMSQSAVQASHPEFVRGFVVPSVPEEGIKDLTRKTVRSHPSRHGSASGRIRAKEEDLRKNTPRQTVISPTLLDRPTPNKNRRVRATKRNSQMGPVVSRKRMEEETEKSQSSSFASSPPSWGTTGSSSLSWTSQQSGVRSSEDSSPRHYMGPVNLQRVKPIPTRRHKPDSHKGSEKMMRGLKRLKNKMGLILHHHHHHHHHHHNGDDGQLTRADRRHSMWKHLGNLFHNAHRTRPVKKYNKSRVNKAPSEDQVGHLHSLAEGFIRHVWKSPKPSKGKIRGLRRQKKLKWWKLPKKAKKRRLKLA